jgi:SET domain-containing protein
MFLIRTRVGPSAIHGNGVFAQEPAAVGQVIWRYDPFFDRLISQAEFNSAQPAIRQYLQMYAYLTIEFPGMWLLSGDDARFLNHSNLPNTVERPFETLARIPIAVGDEITCDYSAFCANWDPAELGETFLDRPAAPHSNLYTRIGRASHGVGVVAIRDIPPGTELFMGDYGATVRIPIAEVEAIEDPEIRRMYFDFCPEEKAAFIAPADFNQLTMGWHLNHSDAPNVKVEPGMRFVCSRLIRKGEELTTDYAAYSDSAKRLIANWTG